MQPFDNCNRNNILVELHKVDNLTPCTFGFEKSNNVRARICATVSLHLVKYAGRPEPAKHTRIR